MWYLLEIERGREGERGRERKKKRERDLLCFVKFGNDDEFEGGSC